MSPRSLFARILILACADVGEDVTGASSALRNGSPDPLGSTVGRAHVEVRSGGFSVRRSTDRALAYVQARVDARGISYVVEGREGEEIVGVGHEALRFVRHRWASEGILRRCF